MKKSTILTLGGSVFGLALGYAAMSATGLVALPFAAATVAETGAGTLTLVSTVPANNDVIETWKKVPTITVTFAEDVTINKDCTGEVLLQRDYGGGEWSDIDSFGPYHTQYVYVPANQPNALVIKPWAPFEDEGKYRVTVPAQFVKNDGVGELNPDAEGEAQASVSYNEKITVEFTLEAVAEHVTYPADGATPSLTQAKKASITYPGATQVTLNSTEATLMKWSAAGVADEQGNVTNYQKVGTYTMSVEGDDKVVLTYDESSDPGLSTISGTTTGYAIIVPAGAIRAFVNFEWFTNKEIEIGKFRPVLLTAADFETDVEDEGLTTESFPAEIMTYTEANLDFKGSASKYAQLKVRTATGSTAQGIYIGTVDPDDSHIVMWKLKDPTSATSAVGNRHLWESGTYFLELPQGIFQMNGVNSTKMELGSWQVTGGWEYNPVLTTKANPAVSAQTVTQDNLMNCPADPGVAAIRVQFFKAVKPNTELGQKITLTKAGSDTPVFEQVNDGVHCHDHIFTGTPMKTMTSKTGSNLDVYYNIGELNGTKYAYQYLTEGGTYTLHVDRGFFMGTSNNAQGQPYYNDEINVTFKIVAPLKFTVTPEVNSELGSLNEIKIEYPEGTTIKVDGTSELWLGDKFDTTGKKSQLALYTPTVDGNVITLTSTDVIEPSGNILALNIPANYWTATYDGQEVPVPATPLEYKVNVYTQAPVLTGLENGATINASQLADIHLTTLLRHTDAGKGKEIGMLYKVEGEEETAICVLKNATSYSDGTTTDLVVTANTDLKALAGGNYKLVIEPSKVTFAGSVLYTGDKVELNFTVNPAVESLLSYLYPNKADFNPSNTYPGAGMGMASWRFNDTNLLLNSAESAKTAKLYYTKVTESMDEEENVTTTKEKVLVATVSLADTEEATTRYMFEPAMAVDPDEPDAGYVSEWGSLALYFVSPATEAVLAEGDYTVEFDEGFFVYAGKECDALSYAYHFTPAAPVDFTYELNPAAGSDVTSLSKIRLTFPNATSVDYEWGGVAKLLGPDGLEVVCNTAYYVYDVAEGAALDLEFGNLKTDWVSGEYTLVVNPNTIAVDQPEYGYTDDAPNFEGIPAEAGIKYTLTVPDPIYLSQHMSLYLPSDLEANIQNSKNPFGEHGMGVVILHTDFDIKKLNGNSNADWIALYYTPENGTADDEEGLVWLNPEDEDSVALLGAGMMAEGDKTDFDPNDFDPSWEVTPATDIALLFGDLYNEGEKDPMSFFQKNGQYRVEFPDGCFVYDGQNVKGTSVTYNYKEEEPKAEWAYTITPEDGEVATLVNNQFVITVKFEDANYIDYLGTSNIGTLTFYDEETELVVDYKGSCTPNWKDTLTFKFGNKNTQWYKGIYTFHIPEGVVGINDMYFADNEVKSTFPGIDCLYMLNEGITVGVTLIGLEAADSYDVYSLDGKAVRLGAVAEDLIELEEGIYLINGKKVMLKK